MDAEKTRDESSEGEDIVDAGIRKAAPMVGAADFDLGDGVRVHADYAQQIGGRDLDDEAAQIPHEGVQLT